MTTHIIGTTLRWTIATFDDAGEPVDADAVPQVALRINQAASLQSVTPTKRAESVGLYDCAAALAGLAEGDHIEALAIVEIDATSYQHAYQWRAVAPATVDSDGTTALLARITARLRTAAEADAADQAILDEIASLAPDTGPDVRKLTILAHTGDDPETGDPVSGLQVRIAGRTITTDTAGAAEVRLNPGEYVAPAIEPVGFEPLAPLEITIGSDDVVLPVALTRTAIAEPDDPALCNVAVDVITQHGRRPDDAIVWAVPADKLPFAVDSLVVTDAVTYTTNSSGRAVVPLLQGEAVKIAVKFGSVEKVIDFAVPNQPTAKATIRV